ncbi:uncharacterized N-acetyltransferase p20-like [Salvia hispanica]|uniref:uncharacterized N-acetyltransferase p20-like n=1 Tax=Salvia hispanica TaxID=49212 RepID=UPI002008FA01|nr:uncharacterized N-acetyltransferase p20-like [Salvia hispanica]
MSLVYSWRRFLHQNSFMEYGSYFSKSIHNSKSNPMAKFSDSDITLRPLDISDADAAVEWYMDEKVSKFCSWEVFPSRESAVDYFVEQDLTHPWNRAICAAGRVVGSITVSSFSGCRGELGYALASEYWGRGIATRAVALAATCAFLEMPHLERLEAVVDVDNPASQRVVEKAGFVREGVLRKYFLLKGRPRDAVIFSLLSTDPNVNYFVDE